MSWSARCDCYNGHNSSSGRCQHRDVTDPTRPDNDVAICEDCRKNCLARQGRLLLADEAIALDACKQLTAQGRDFRCEKVDGGWLFEVR